ncbi:hypothetical protein HMPREF9442_00301 [Paraprevotella xylaniphila YIT 11841]|uniref:Uncharacterized protein n=1 Tax=Paraprevotella xylaniphila YIT 11841 TaxID=762982 RepID=F3QQ63_9BACT|nr:hypothetical protein HMPREF9442_00301 [Paraprevotella xylaniphila YIT 11841]
MTPFRQFVNDIFIVPKAIFTLKCENYRLFYYSIKRIFIPLW